MSAEPSTAAAAASSGPLADPAGREAVATPVRPGARLLALSSLCALAIACAGYWWTGAPSAVGSHAAAKDEGTREQQLAEFSGMVDKLAARMQTEPSAEGLSMLGRSYLVLGRADEAVNAYRQALKMQPDNANLLADTADALGVKNGRSLSGEPMALIERALKLEPENLKALMLAGSEAFDRNDMGSARRLWQRMVDKGPADHPLVQQAGAAVQELQRRAGAGDATAAAAAAAAAVVPTGSPSAAAGPTTAAAAAASAVQGRVELAASLKAKVSPEDTVFVFARAAEGGGPPLAVLRKQVKDLPLDFRLDDSLAMTPSRTLSGATRVIVGARISRSGTANAQPDDPQALSAPVAPGASGLSLVIGGAAAATR